MQGEPLTNKDRIGITTLLIICFATYVWLFKIGVLSFLFKVFIGLFIISTIYCCLTNFMSKKKKKE